jgi:hypothetical protein
MTNMCKVFSNLRTLINMAARKSHEAKQACSYEVCNGDPEVMRQALSHMASAKDTAYRLNMIRTFLSTRKDVKVPSRIVFTGRYSQGSVSLKGTSNHSTRLMQQELPEWIAKYRTLYDLVGLPPESFESFVEWAYHSGPFFKDTSFGKAIEANRVRKHHYYEYLQNNIGTKAMTADSQLYSALSVYEDLPFPEKDQKNIPKSDLSYGDNFEYLYTYLWKDDDHSVDVRIDAFTINLKRRFIFHCTKSKACFGGEHTGSPEELAYAVKAALLDGMVGNTNLWRKLPSDNHAWYAPDSAKRTILILRNRYKSIYFRHFENMSSLLTLMELDPFLRACPISNVSAHEENQFVELLYVGKSRVSIKTFSSYDVLSTNRPYLVTVEKIESSGSRGNAVSNFMNAKEVVSCLKENVL